MWFITKFIHYIQYLFKVKNLTVKEPHGCLPIDHTTALKYMRERKLSSIAYKRYLSREHMISSKMLIQKMEVKLDNLDYKYLYSTWIWDKNFKNRELLKFGEEDFEFMEKLQKESLFSSENKTNLEKYLLSSEEKEYLINPDKILDLVGDTNNDTILEYLLDQLFKKYPLDLLKLTIDSRFFNLEKSETIKDYYVRLVEVLFDFLDYKTLDEIQRNISSVISPDKYQTKLNQRIVWLIQRTNILQSRLERLERERGIKINT